jgi:adenylosuccinate lyase
MINRYEIKEISTLWSDEAKFSYYLKVEVAHLMTLAEEGILPQAIVEKISKTIINPERILEIEKTTNHDVIAFCTSITEQLTPVEARYFHFGLTSSDIIDTAHALIIKDSMKIIEKDLQELKKSLREKALDTGNLLCLGRSHGISAEAMIFGQKFLSFEAELTRRIKEWGEAISELTGQLSGAVGNYTVVSPESESKTLSRLDLKVEPVSTQVIPRDHYAKIISTGALIGTLFERIATELRLLQHSDIDEVKEGFSKGQKGSSTMPHKKNPISSENITGMARILRSHVTPALENCVLWHERDISHSSAERMIFPDHFGLIAYSARRMKNVIQNIVIDRDRIELKVSSNEKVFSSFVLHKLIECNPDVKREDLYEVVQDAFFKSKNKTQLITNLETNLKEKNFSHDVSSWIDLENLRSHYKAQFQAVLNRN